jgi:hypothetical protein
VSVDKRERSETGREGGREGGRNGATDLSHGFGPIAAKRTALLAFKSSTTLPPSPSSLPGRPLEGRTLSRPLFSPFISTTGSSLHVNAGLPWQT